VFTGILLICALLSFKNGVTFPKCKALDVKKKMRQLYFHSLFFDLDGKASSLQECGNQGV